jgi:glycosyltransferase involved in cell wall biosynthesis
MTRLPVLRRLLMVAYHFPPLAGSSGIQRTLRFAQHLPAFGWQPMVLTAHPRAYERFSPDLASQIPADCIVERAFALDTARHLALGGRYVAAMARPDRWVSWRLGAIPAGLRMIRRHAPAAIWSTYPIATAHLIGDALARRSGLPWIADFRDPMAQDGYPADPETWRQFKAIEQCAMQSAALNLFTTPGAARTYSQRYPFAAERIATLENGYDEETFVAADRSVDCSSSLNPGAVTLLHSGIVYPSERDPTQLFVALGRLKREGRLPTKPLRLRFRAAVHDRLLVELAQAHDVAELIELLPPVGYQEALAEMLRADALLVMQGSGCNEQIPAKIYEYLRADRPVIGLCDPTGDTAGVLREAGLDGCIAHLASADAIAGLLPAFVEAVQTGRAPHADGAAVRQASRVGRAEALARMLDALMGDHPS